MQTKTHLFFPAKAKNLPIQEALNELGYDYTYSFLF